MFGEVILQGIFICFKAQVSHDEARLILSNAGGVDLLSWPFSIPIFLVRFHGQFQGVSIEFEVISLRSSLAVTAHGKGDEAQVTLLPFLGLQHEALLDRAQLREHILQLSSRRVSGSIGVQTSTRA